MDFQLCPDTNLSQELQAAVRTEAERSEVNESSVTTSLTPIRIPSPSTMVTDFDSLDADPESSDDEGAQTNLVREHLKDLFINPVHNRFFGKSSGVKLVKTAIDLKSEYAGKMPDENTVHVLGRKRPEYWNLLPVRCHCASYLADAHSFLL